MEHACKRCGYSWLARIKTPPKQCPSCKSRYWDKERKDGVPKLRTLSAKP